MLPHVLQKHREQNIYSPTISTSSVFLLVFFCDVGVVAGGTFCDVGVGGGLSSSSLSLSLPEESKLSSLSESPKNIIVDKPLSRFIVLESKIVIFFFSISFTFSFGCLKETVLLLFVYKLWMYRTPNE